MSEAEKKMVELKGAYLQGRREEIQEVKAMVAKQIHMYQDAKMGDAAAVLYAFQVSIINREHSKTRLPPPPEERPANA